MKLIDLDLFRFPSEVNSGVLEIISPPRSFYPDLENIRLSFGDDKDRVRYLR
jgi:alpha-1,3-mannosylglycoprotein beta-1,4-N-acetylglucosaminyltransferase A/B